MPKQKKRPIEENEIAHRSSIFIQEDEVNTELRLFDDGLFISEKQNENKLYANCLYVINSNIDDARATEYNFGKSITEACNIKDKHNNPIGVEFRKMLRNDDKTNKLCILLLDSFAKINSTDFIALRSQFVYELFAPRDVKIFVDDESGMVIAKDQCVLQTGEIVSILRGILHYKARKAAMEWKVIFNGWNNKTLLANQGMMAIATVLLEIFEFGNVVVKQSLGTHEERDPNTGKCINVSNGNGLFTSDAAKYKSVKKNTLETARTNNQLWHCVADEMFKYILLDGTKSSCVSSRKSAQKFESKRDAISTLHIDS